MTTKSGVRSSGTLGIYETDFVAWAEQQAALLEQKRFEQLDLPNLIDEVLDLSRRERQALIGNLKVVLLHLLKWNYQPAMRSNSWLAAIREHRQRLEEQLQDSPSLRPYLELKFTDCYQKALLLAADETGLPKTTFSPECPFAIHDVLDPDFLGNVEADS